MRAPMPNSGRMLRRTAVSRGSRPTGSVIQTVPGKAEVGSRTGRTRAGRQPEPGAFRAWRPRSPIHGRGLQPTQRATRRVGRQAHPREWHADCRQYAADGSAVPCTTRLPRSTGRHDPPDARIPAAPQRLRFHRRDRPAPVPPTGRTRPVPGLTHHRRAGRPATAGAPDRCTGDRRPRPGRRRPAAHPPACADAAQLAGPPRQRVPGEPGQLRAVSPTGPPTPPNAPAPAARACRAAGRRPVGRWSAAAQAGDMAAFSELFDRYYDVVFRYVLFRMGDRTLAEDITQETFLRALRRISSVTYQGRDIGAWFVTIARNLIFDHVKSSRYRLESTTSDIVELSPEHPRPRAAGAGHARRTRSCCAASASSTRTSRSASPCGSCRACPSRRRRRSWTATRGR